VTEDLKTRVANRRNGGNGNAAPAAGNGGGQLKKVDRQMADARQMFTRMKGEFAVALPKHVGVDRFMRMALTCMRKTPALLDCEPASVIAALMEAARLGLEPGTKEAAIVPFGNKATFIAQWQGLVKLMYQSGQIDAVTAEFIHENDEWEYSIGDGGRFWHRPNLLGDRGKRQLAYAFATLKGGGRTRVVFLSRPEAEEIRDQYSKNFANAERNRRQAPELFERNPGMGKFNSTWHTEFDAMWRKSAVRRLADWAPSSPELRDLLMKENEAGEMRDAVEQIIGDDVLDGEVVSDTDDDQPDDDQPGDVSPADGTAAADAEAAAETGAHWPPVAKPGEGS
jgi:recombination protein RecT